METINTEDTTTGELNNNQPQPTNPQSVSTLPVNRAGSAITGLVLSSRDRPGREMIKGPQPRPRADPVLNRA